MAINGVEPEYDGASSWFFNPFRRASCCSCEDRVGKQDVADADSPVRYVSDGDCSRPRPPPVSEEHASNSSKTNGTYLEQAKQFASNSSSGNKSCRQFSSNSSSKDPKYFSSKEHASSVDAAIYATTGSHYVSEINEAVLVNMDEEFDFYSTATKSTRIMKMADVHGDVLHQREQKTTWGLRRLFGNANTTSNNDELSPTESARESATPLLQDQSYDEDMNSSFGSQTSLRSVSEADSDERSDAGSDAGSDVDDDSQCGDPASPNLSPTSGQRRPSLLIKTGTSHFDAENVTNWGILISRLLRRRVAGISTAVTKAAHKRRQTRKLQNGQNTNTTRYVLPSVRARAESVVEQMKILAKQVADETEDHFDSDWMQDHLIVQLFGEDFIDTLMLLANTARKVVSSQPILAEAQLPCRVFGDIHGQFRDLLIFFRAFGMPSERSGTSFVFNGDFVDRGIHGLEVVGVLFALKVLMPETIWLIRGNHEDRAMNERYGFQQECCDVLGANLGPKTFELINRTFDELPIACVVAEKVLVVHGGLGDGKFTLNDIRSVERPLMDKQLASDPMVWNMLWSDPIEDDKQIDQQGVFGVHVSPRASTGLFKFGWNVTKTFCAYNGLGMVIRSHQSKAGSLGFSVMHDRMLVRVFSARDYEAHGNDGAVLLLRNKELSDTSRAISVRPQVVGSITKANEKFKSKRRSTRKRTTLKKS